MEYLAEAVRLTINKCLPASRADEIQIFINLPEEILQQSHILIDVPDIGSLQYPMSPKRDDIALDLSGEIRKRMAAIQTEPLTHPYHAAPQDTAADGNASRP